MKDLTKYFIDLSKCTEEQQKHIISLLPDINEEDYNVEYGKYLKYSSYVGWYFGNDVDHKEELTYPEFIKLFEGGDGEKTDSIITDRAIDLVFQNTSFGENPNYRQILRDGIAKVKEGYANGRTVSLCLLELGLVEHSNEYSVTKIGEVFFAEPLNSNQ